MMNANSHFGTLRFLHIMYTVSSKLSNKAVGNFVVYYWAVD